MNLDDLVALYSSPDSVPPHPALDRLGEFDWSTVRDAYGPGTRVPALLRALNSPEPTHRSYALQALLGHIWHQGTIYAATATAVPLLFQMLASEETRDKQSVVILLATVADGRPEFAECENDLSAAERWRDLLRKRGRSLDDEMADGREYGAKIRHEIATHLDKLYPFLRDPDPEVRVAIAVALGRFPETVTRVTPDLHDALEHESDDYVRQALREAIDRSGNSPASNDPNSKSP